MRTRNTIEGREGPSAADSGSECLSRRSPALYDGGLTAGRGRPRRAFTLIEIMIAITLFMLVMTAIYSSWMSILKGTKIGLDAAEEVQRKRISMRVVQDALMCAQLYEANAIHYSFVSDTSDPNFAALSFVAELPSSFPRSGRYGGEKVRRVTFTIEPGKDRSQNLVMRQTPILRLLDEQEEDYPLILARNVELFTLEFFNDRSLEWETEWLATNQLPGLLRVTLATSERRNARLDPDDVVSRVVYLAAQAVPIEAQRPSANARGGGRTNTRGLQPNEPLPPGQNPLTGDPRLNRGRGVGRGPGSSLPPRGANSQRFQSGRRGGGGR